MLSLSELTVEKARSIDAVVFDLDDTVLDHGRLTEVAYRALFRLREAGLKLFASTGRPAGWAEIVARQWPVDAALAENGAIAWIARGRGVELVDGVDKATRHERRAKLDAIAHALLSEFREAALADDNATRISDVTFDIGEHWQVDKDVVQAMRAFAAERGARTFASSVHMHITLDEGDKATGYLALASRHFDKEPATALRSAAFVGDSANDEPAFAAFGLTFGVANIARHRHLLRALPAYVAQAEMGQGFAEIADRIVALRA